MKRFLIALALASCLWAADNAPKTRVLLVTGGHSHEISFYSIFEGAADLDINVDPHPQAYSGDLRKRYDVVLMYDLVSDLDDSRKQHLREFAESGKGIVALHHSICSFRDSWPWYTQELIGGSYQAKSTYLHGQMLRITPAEPHPITRGIGPFEINDETYKSMWISPKNQVLLKTDDATSDGPVAWISPYEKSRVVYVQLGHGSEAHENVTYRKLVRNAILWSAGRLK
jgi:type 1 glutamine amidotransferase